MSLNDRQHVEAVAIIRALRDAVSWGFHDDPPDAVKAADVWLRENHPEPAVYMNALRDETNALNQHLSSEEESP